ADVVDEPGYLTVLNAETQTCDRRSRALPAMTNVCLDVKDRCAKGLVDVAARHRDEPADLGHPFRDPVRGDLAGVVSPHPVGNGEDRWSHHETVLVPFTTHAHVSESEPRQFDPGAFPEFHDLPRRVPPVSPHRALAFVCTHSSYTLEERELSLAGEEVPSVPVSPLDEVVDR